MHLLSSPGLLRTLLGALLVSNIVLTCAACRRRAAESNANGNSANASANADEMRATPPFPTREPARYQATRIVSSSPGQQAANIQGSSTPTTQQTFIARDGEKRREEMEMLPGVRVTYLQLSSGRYVLYPEKKLYAEMRLDGGGGAASTSQSVPSDFGPDKLVKGAHIAARYEKLGTEEVNGRMTTKYRVTGPQEEGSETIVWADESLGMPVKFESTSKDGAKYSMELRDIKQEVDAALFELPKDYQKVEHKELISNLNPR